MGYHGRASSVVVSGTPVRRPCGQVLGPESKTQPVFAPSAKLDVELELGAFLCAGNALGVPVRVDEAGGDDLWFRAGERLVGEGCAGLGVCAAGPVWEQEFCDDGGRVGCFAAGVGGVSGQGVGGWDGVVAVFEGEECRECV